MGHFKPSQHQQRLFDEITNTTNSILVSAVAGSGKTTSIVKSLELLPNNKDIIFLAFNKSIVKELSEKVPKNVQVSTLHSFGCSTLFRHYGKIVISEDKIYSLAVKMSHEWNLPKTENIYVYCHRVRQLCDIMRQTLVTDDEEAIFELSLKYNIDVFSTEIEHAIKVVEKADKSLDKIDFVDMIYQLAKRNLKTKKYDYVFIDEVQDLNKAQQMIIKKILKPNGRFIGVGDPYQSIYGFAGADFESFSRMKNLVPNVVELPLSICYRCSKNIVNKARTIIPHIEFNPTQKDGIVRYDGKFSEINNGDWVLCRNTKPLVMAFIQLLRDGKKANIKGREIGRGLALLIQKTQKKEITSLIKHLKTDRIRLKEKLLQKGFKNVDENEKVLNFSEKIEIITIISEITGPTVKKLLEYINTIFLDEEIPGITLSTIHKSKGLEASKVFVICAGLMPSKFAKQDHEKIQENNLEYVMITRAKDELVYIPDEEFNPDLVQRDLIED